MSDKILIELSREQARALSAVDRGDPELRSAANAVYAQLGAAKLTIRRCENGHDYITPVRTLAGEEVCPVCVFKFRTEPARGPIEIKSIAAAQLARQKHQHRFNQRMSIWLQSIHPINVESRPVFWPELNAFAKQIAARKVEETEI